jgi:hypothetical protein
VLSQPPLEAPVLAQHTLSYIFSVRPQDRATYFKTLLEVTDLDHLRNEVAGLAQDIDTAENVLLSKSDNCARIPAVQDTFTSLRTGTPDLATLTAGFMEAARILVAGSGPEVPQILEERIAIIEATLAERRSKTFPVSGFTQRLLSGWNAPEDAWNKLEGYVAERKKIDDETQQLAALFDEALKIPTIADATDAVDCPLCGTESALTPERVNRIRQHLEVTKDYRKAETAAKSALSQLSASAASLLSATDAALPAFMTMNAQRRRETGFRVNRIRELLGDAGSGLLEPWLVQVRLLGHSAAALRRAARNAQAAVDQQARDFTAALKPAELRAAFAPLGGLHVQFAAAVEAYNTPAQALGAALNAILDAQSNTEGWQDYLDIANKPGEVRDAIIDRQARSSLAQELEAALRQIDRAKEAVLDDKFLDYSDLVQAWWERLRPDEATFFSAVRPRPGARRTIDFKAGLSANIDRIAPKLRDVIAVFSQSQLHCLGLALFLARAQHEQLGFIVLDDPVLSSDEDYRVRMAAERYARCASTRVRFIGRSTSPNSSFILRYLKL